MLWTNKPGIYTLETQKAWKLGNVSIFSGNESNFLETPLKNF